MAAEQKDPLLADQDLTREQRESLKQMVASQGWNNSQVLWARHSIRKETEKAQALRISDLDKAIYLQGFLDGMKAKDNIVRNAVTGHPEKDEPGPSY